MKNPKRGDHYKGVQDTYTLLSVIDSGGNGQVWKASSTKGGEVAIKLLKPQGRRPVDAVGRFEREISILKGLRDIDCVLPLIDSSDSFRKDDPSSHWFVMPLAISLQNKLGVEATLQEICSAGAGIAKALAVIHSRGTSHRDIKPNNLFWHNEQWCLGDFGIAERQDFDSLTDEGKKLGPAHYIAPEMLNGAASSDGTKADVYSLGKTVWVLATGQNYPLPGVHDPSFRTAAIASYTAGERSRLLDELVRRMTQLAPDSRPPAEEVAHELSILAKDNSLVEPVDTEAAFRALNAALVPHRSRAEESKRQVELAMSTAKRISNAAHMIAKELSAQTGLTLEPRFDAPDFWGYREHLGGAAIEVKDEGGHYVEAGSDTWMWRLSICTKYQLLSNNELHLATGFDFDRIYRGQVNNVQGLPEGWAAQGHALNGSASVEEQATELISGLRANLPAMLQQFTQLVSQT